MGSQSLHRRPGILRKLVFINLLIIAAFFMIALSVVFSFRNIGSFSGTIIGRDMNEVVKNAGLGRDLGVVFAQSDLFISTFLNGDMDNRAEADRILAKVASLREKSASPRLRDSLKDFEEELHVLFRQCSKASECSMKINSLELNMERELDGLEKALSRRLISQGQQGGDVSMLEQIGILLLDYRETLLKISIRHTKMTSKHPELFNPLDGKQILELLESLKLRLRPLTASEPFVAAYGARILQDVRESETATNSFILTMDTLKESLSRVEGAKGRVVSAMKISDEGIYRTADSLRGNITDVMHSSSILILMTSGTIIACLVLFTFLFSYRDIRRPMGQIRRELESIRGGDLETTIRMNRSDEWGEIEDALNGMVRELKSSYSELQEKNLELELTQSDLEEKVVELESEMNERQRAEVALWESEQRLEATIQGSPIPIFVIDSDMKVICWNRALERLSGTSAEEVIGTDRAWKGLYEEEQPVLADLLVKGDPAEIPRWYGDKFSPSRLVDGAYEVTDFFPAWGDGGKWLHITAAALMNERGELIGAIETLEDISEQRHLEEQLRHSQKMEAIGQLAGGVAHDFNNILTGILGFGNMLQLKIGGDNPRTRKYIDQIVASAERGAKLTNSLLAFSRKHVVELKPVNLNDIIGRVQNLLYRLVREDVQLRIVRGENCIIRADSMQIEQVLMNLVTNARDAMHDRGILTIATERIVLDQDFVRRHGFGETGEYAVISVTDSGEGMDEKTRERIFEPFFTSKKAGKGTGLGLSIVYGIIKQHNGYIDVQSVPGKGTTFRIYLPLITDSVEEASTSDETINLPRGSETILLADDDPIVRDLTTALLEEFGYTVIDAEDGADAVDKFLLHKEEISLVIMDVVMPKKNGREVYSEIKDHQPEMKALFISGYTGDVLSRKGMLDKDFEYISKPYAQSAFLKKVRELLDS